MLCTMLAMRCTGFFWDLAGFSACSTRNFPHKTPVNLCRCPLLPSRESQQTYSSDPQPAIVQSRPHIRAGVFGSLAQAITRPLHILSRSGGSLCRHCAMLLASSSEARSSSRASCRIVMVPMSVSGCRRLACQYVDTRTQCCCL
jgi:hypothetical protein